MINKSIAPNRFPDIAAQRGKNALYAQFERDCKGTGRGEIHSSRLKIFAPLSGGKCVKATR